MEHTGDAAFDRLIAEKDQQIAAKDAALVVRDEAIHALQRRAEAAESDIDRILQVSLKTSPSS